MPAEDHFIQRGLLRVKVNDYLRRELRRAGYAGVDLQKTPLGMRVVVYAARPGMVIGRRGTTVRTLTETLETEFGLEAPQIEVSEVEVPELNGAIMAERLAQRLERGDHFRRAAYGVLRRIIGANAKGVEISISGKLTSRRARYQKFRSGFVAKTGEPIRTAVSHGIAYAILKPGILGVQVRIMLPDLLPPDRPIIQYKELEVEAAPTPTEAEVEVVEEELPIEEAPPIEEFTEVSEEPVAPTAETEEGLPPPAVEEVPKEPEPVKEEKPAPKKPKPKPKKKVEKKPAKKPKPKAKPKKAEPKKPKAKPKAKPKKKAEEKPKAKVKAKPKAEKAKAAKKAEKPKTKTKSSSKKSAVKKEKKSAKK